MPEALNQLTFLARLCNLGRNINVSFLETPVHCFFLDAYQVNDQIGAVDQVSDAFIVPSIEAFDLDHLQHMLPFSAVIMSLPSESKTWSAARNGGVTAKQYCTDMLECS